MNLAGLLSAGRAGSWRYFALVAACILLVATLLSCGGGPDAVTEERMLELEAKAHSQEESLESLSDEYADLKDEVANLSGKNSDLRAEIAALRQEQANSVKEQEAAQDAQVHEEEVADSEEVQEQQLADLEAGQTRINERLDELDDQVLALEEVEADTFDWLRQLADQVFALEQRQSRTSERSDDLDTRLEDLEYRVSQVEALFTAKLDDSKPADEPSAAQPAETVLDRTVLDRTRKLAEGAGGEVYNIDSREAEERAILVMPLEPINGNPLIVSLHGYGGNSADQSMYFPLHERLISRGFGLLLPNGTPDGEGNPSWNPTDEIGDSAKASGDDYAYLAGLVARAREVKDFGPVYVFGNSNGGFMAYHLACKGLPGLRAVASLAGTSYVDDSNCNGASPVSVLHIHGTADEVIRFEGEVAEPDPRDDGKPAFYAGAQEKVMRWAQRAGCDWPEHPQPYTTLDLDQDVPGPETYAIRLESGCAPGINIELWMGAEGGHSPGYGDAFVDALLDWLLSQN